ncbi:SulP family inorganic anion transporter [Tessaracoccus caeni]|uniref:SulP family inorganic anion transporter n=1 Tax=Tessaracoccus caeni TaxID=3031239 RepID=UPI0023DBFA9F|nr:SulP family inorganic anion transporter [Tessaracoccus caeni]MDF1486988.1 SulP family inorganic anion transporter [Tessaracoccus caeni]
MSALPHLRGLLPRRSDYAELSRSWRADLMAGLTVGIVALPLALGFGISSGAGAEAGIVTAVVAGFVAAVFGGSHIQVSGPTGAMVVVLAPIVAAHGIGAVALLSLMAGLILLITGIARMGRAVALIPWPVIEGFTLGIAAIIFLQQVPALTGAEGELSTNVIVAALQSVTRLELDYALWALLCVAIVVACMLGLPRIHRSIPASLVGIIVATTVTTLAGAPLAVIGELPHSLPAPVLPSVSLGLLGELALPALTVAALAGIESLLSVRVAASMSSKGRYEADRELVGQGLASIGAGLFGGMPATGAIARTAVNLRAGARTRVAAGFHSVVLLAIILFAAAPVGMVPLAALAGVLMMTALRMVQRRTAMSILRSTKPDALAFVVTAVVTISVDLIFAVIIGVVVAGFFAVRSLARAAGVRREELPGEPVDGDDKIALLRIKGPLMFAAADRVSEAVTGQQGVSVVILAMSQLQVVDATGAHTLGEMVTALERRGVTVLIKGVLPSHKGLFERLGVMKALRHQKHLFPHLAPALEHARSHVARERDAAMAVSR